MKFSTGEVVWKDRSVGRECDLRRGQALIYSVKRAWSAWRTQRRKDSKEISRFKIPKGEFLTWTPPVVAGGRMYLREQDNLYCFDIKAK
jgi:hypothetical protein